MKNCVHPPADPSSKLSLPVASGTESGDFVLVGDQGLFGVAATDRGEGGNASTHATVWTEGVYDLPVGTTTAADVGDKVYAVVSNGNLTPAAGTEPANLHVGWFLEAKGTTAGQVVRIKLAKV